MPQEPTDDHTTTPSTEAQSAPSAKPELNPQDFKLPTREIHSLESAQRVSAAELVSREQTTQLPEVHAPARTPMPPKQASAVEPIETFKGDIARLMEKGKVSSVSAAAAEARRRETQAFSQTQAASDISWQGVSWRMLGLVGGVVLLVAALGIVGSVMLRTVALPATPAAQAPFIRVDAAAAVPINPQGTRADMLTALESAKEHVALSVGLIEALVPEVGSSTGSVPLAAQNFLGALAPDIPQQLLRSLQPTYLLGVHSFAQNQPFLILSVDSYQQGYAGMLAWEPTLHSDLLPLFAYTPSPHIPEQGIATSSASTSPQVLATGFVDRVVENHDARVLQDPYGDITFLWTFLDPNTILITTNEYTVREVISRLKQAPTITIPGQ